MTARFVLALRAAFGLLRRHGVSTLILAGWRENGSVLDIAIGRYQLLTQLSNNAKNEPLKKGAVTLSRGDLITFR